MNNKNLKKAIPGLKLPGMTGRGSRENSGQNGGRRLPNDFLKPSSKEVRSSELGIYS